MRSRPQVRRPRGHIGQGQSRPGHKTRSTGRLAHASSSAALATTMEAVAGFGLPQKCMRRLLGLCHPDGVLSNLWQIVWVILRCLLPYPDPLRRVRFHRKARKLITCDPWPGEQAKGPQAAQLALLRLIWLQRQVRRAARWRQTEAAALLARSATETCILGLYCLYNDDATKALTTKDSEGLRNVLSYLADAGLISTDTIEKAAASLDTGVQLPNVWRMTQRLSDQQHGKQAVALYRRFYAPLSHFFTHANGFTLLRHVRPDNRLRYKPLSPWTRRAAVRLTDTCAGALATAIAQHAGRPSAWFAEYADAHSKRVLTPLGAIGGISLARALAWRNLIPAIEAITETRRYLEGQWQADTPAERLARVRDGLDRALQLAQAIDDPIRSILLDDFAARVLRDVESANGQLCIHAGRPPPVSLLELFRLCSVRR
jgi:hypothetical protein